MKRVLNRVVGALSGAGLFLASVAPVLAQTDYDYSDYTYDWETTDAASEAAAGGLLAGMSILWIAVWCCAIIFGIANLVIFIMSLIHCIQNAPEDKKTMWILIILLVPFGAWIYFFTKKKEWGPKAESK